MLATALRASIALCLLVPASALADDVSKEICLDAHSRGQDAREQNKLSLARKLFLTCAQSGCPTLVQGDCARSADDLARLLPTLSFAARDEGGTDLPDTSVYVDDLLVATRLDDGRARDVDPGRHTVRFVHGAKEHVQTIVVGTGERGRTITATFGAPPGARRSLGASEPARPKKVHARGSKILIATGGAVAVSGIVLGVVGLARVPANCSISSHECSAPPGDPAFDSAGSAIGLANVGFVAGTVGLAAAAAGVYWYMTSAKDAGSAPRERREARLLPWVSPDGAGLAVGGRL